MIPTLLLLSLIISFVPLTVSAPNFIFILADDWGIGDIGAYGAPHPSPNIDKLASEGSKFIHFTGVNPVCSPSRTGFMTGRFPATLKIHYALSPNPEQNAKYGMANYVNNTVPTITKLLQDAGYETAHYGKWHLGDTPDAPPVNSYGIDDSSTYASNPKNSQQIGTFADIWFPSNSSRLIADHGIQFMKESHAKGKPFYINLWFHISHAPLNPTAKQLAPFPMDSFCPWSGNKPDTQDYKRCPKQVFHASQHDADQQVGRIVQAVDDLGLKEETVIFFSADNGPEDENVYFNSVGLTGTFRGRKRSLYEGGTRLPFIVRWPSKVPVSVSDAPIGTIDYFPTIASLAGISLPPSVAEHLVGVDISKTLLTGAPPPPRKVHLMTEYRFRVVGDCWNDAPRLAIKEGNMKLLLNPDLSRVELYNLSESLWEGTNLAPFLPSEVDKLKTPLLAWYKTLPDGAGIVKHEGCKHAFHDFSYPTVDEPLEF